MQRAVEAAGGQTALARLIGVTQGLIWHYVRNAQPPPERCADIERVTGVACEELRPDVDWDRDDAGRVTGYRVRFSTDASVEQSASTVDPADAGVIEGAL
jgi:DNA-binding transcriptional regulator YdaS (Cro superfamily)